MTNEALTVQLLEWLNDEPRPYADVLDAWHTTCPRLSIWEDACGDGFIDYAAATRLVSVSAKGASLLAQRRAARVRCTAAYTEGSLYEERATPMGHYHCVVWIDHREAHVIHFNPDDAETSVIHPKSKHEHLHHKHGAVGAGRTPEDHAYYQNVADAIKDAGELLIVGPAAAKLEFFKHLQAHAPAVAARVVSVETVDHPTDGELLRFARRHFDADDRMRPQT